MKYLKIIRISTNKARKKKILIEANNQLKNFEIKTFRKIIK